MSGDSWGKPGGVPLITIGKTFEDEKGKRHVELEGGGTMPLRKFKQEMRAKGLIWKPLS
jgi:hypothetical protein